MMKKLLYTLIFTILAFGVSQAQSIEVTGLGNVIPGDGSNTPSTTDDTDFGSVDVASGSVTHTFTITNTTVFDLLLTGIDNMSGTNASDFTKTNPVNPLLNPGQSTTFTVTFDPNTPAGLKSAIVSVDVNSVLFGTNEKYIFNIQGTATVSVPAPEIDVIGNGVSIVTPDLTPSTTDDTDFGQVDVTSGSLTHTFTIANTGNAPLNLTGSPLVLIAGASGDFTVTNFPTTPIPALSSTTFDITFDPSATGIITANVLIQNDDSDEGNFLFTIQGEGTVAVPDIDVSGNGNSIITPDFTPSTTDDTDFGQADITTGLITHTFTIANTGGTPLTLTGTPLVNIAGGSGDFTVTNLPSTPIPAFSSTTFDITFDPSAIGIITANVLIQSDDPDEGNFLFTVQGEGTNIVPEPEMDLLDNTNAPLASGGTDDFGQADITTGSVPHTYTIQNNGTGDLTLTDPSPYVTITGVDAADFTLTVIPTSPIAASNSTTFEITFNPTGTVLGIRTATVSIANDDSNENPYTFTVQGEAIDANNDAPLLITQYYEGAGNDQWIEVKNISQRTVFSGEYYLAQYAGVHASSGYISANVPDENISINGMAPGEVRLFKNPSAALPSSGNLGAATVVPTSVCTFDGNDVVLISSSNGTDCYSKRIDIVGVVQSGTPPTWGANKCIIKGCGTTEQPSLTFDATISGSNVIINDYIELTLDQVNNADPSTNIALGTQTVGPTIWTSSWDNGLPDITKVAIINGTYNAASGTFETCNLTVSASGNLNLDGGTNNYVYVDNSLSVNGNFTIGDTESLLSNENTSISGSINKKETTTTLNNYRDFTYWSSPVNTTISQAFSGVNPNRIFEWRKPADGSGYGFWDPASGTMTAARGYIAEAPDTTPDGGTYTATFSGTPHNGLVSIALGLNNDGNTDTDFNLIGNPYPSAIDIDEFIAFDNGSINNDAMDGTIWLWTHNTALDGSGEFLGDDYATYNLSGGTQAGSGGATPTNFIGSGQGFFIKATSTDDVWFSNTMRVGGNNTQFYRSNDIKKSATVEKDRIWLNVTSATGGAFNQTLIAFMDNATDGYDRGYDGSKLSASWISFYSKIDTLKYAIQGLGSFALDKKVTLGFDTYIPQTMTYKISIANIEGVLKDNDVYLIDKELGITHDLKQSDYEFTVDGTGNFPDRFALQFTKTTLSIDDLNLADNEFVVINQENSLNVRSNNAIARLKVYDITGRLLLDKKPNDNDFDVPTYNIRKGTVLILNATFDNGAEMSKKAIKY